jgi:hypothetical protein
MTEKIVFREKDNLVRAIVAEAETPHYGLPQKRSFIYTHQEDKYSNLCENTHQEET